LSGQILSPGANLVSQLTAIGGELASQIEERVEGLGARGEGGEIAN